MRSSKTPHTTRKISKKEAGKEAGKPSPPPRLSWLVRGAWHLWWWWSARGAAKKVDGPFRAFAILLQILGVSGFSVGGVQKHHSNIVANFLCRNLFTKKSTKFQCQVFLDSFGFIAFFWCLLLSEGCSKTPQTAFCKKIVSIFFKQKIDPKKPNPKPTSSRSRFAVLSRFSAFLGDGSWKRENASGGGGEGLL
jgi:hypothetical protein